MFASEGSYLCKYPTMKWVSDASNVQPRTLVAVSFACEDFGGKFDDLFPVCALNFFIFFYVEISLRTLVPIFKGTAVL